MTEYNRFSGIAQAVYTKKPNDYGAYSVHLQLKDENEVEKFKKSGIQVTLSEDNKVWFRRKHQSLMKGELVTLGAPDVIDAKGNIIEDIVGEGSKVILEVKSFQTMKGIGHTLEKVVVMELVPHEGANREYVY